MNRIRTGFGVAAVAVLLGGCGGSSYSLQDAAALYESQDGAQNVRCKHLEKDPASVFRCHANRTGGPAAGMKIRVNDAEAIVVESCGAVYWRPHPPPDYRPPCLEIGIPWQGLQPLQHIARSN
jgi:hypothetical protein